MEKENLKQIYIYNTLTKQKEEFKTIREGICSMYSCGPTVYDYAHIGNFRYFLFVDNLRRVLRYAGYTLNHVMNITDVGHLVSDADEGEDKMVKAARREQKSPWEIAKFYEQAFITDLKKVNMYFPEKIVRATENIKEMEEYVLGIIKNGYAYETEDTVYFDTSKLKDYGILSGKNLENQEKGARVEFDNRKKNITDFALWIKAPENHIMKWDSFFGLSYPGWHIECSAMSKKYLGEVFDIHTGGADHIQIHHENEIAQSKGYCGKNPANFWMHSEFLQVDGGKMSKSLGNTYTISDLEKMGYSGLDFKYLTLNAHYKTKVNFTFNSLKNAQESLKKLRKLYFKHKTSKNGKENLSKETLEVIKEVQEEFEKAILNDLNMPVALSQLWKIAKLEDNTQIYTVLKKFDEVFGLDLDNEEIYNEIISNENIEVEILELEADVQKLVNERDRARENKDYALSDELRTKLQNMGYTVIDSAEGTKLQKNN